MNFDKIIREVNELKSGCIIDLLNDRNIKVVFDASMNKNKMDSVLKILENRSIIFIKTDLNDDYKRFVLLHELGHYILHYNADMQYTFYLSRYKNRLEIEANVFACTCLLNDEDCDQVDLINLLERKGVPEKIALQFYDNLALINDKHDRSFIGGKNDEFFFIYSCR